MLPLIIMVIAALIGVDCAEDSLLNPCGVRVTSPLTYDLGNLDPYLIFKGSQPRVTYRYGRVARIIVTNYTSPAPGFQVSNNRLTMSQACPQNVSTTPGNISSTTLSQVSEQNVSSTPGNISSTPSRVSEAAPTNSPLRVLLLSLGAILFRFGDSGKRSLGAGALFLTMGLWASPVAAQMCSPDLEVVIELPGYSPRFAGGPCMPPPGSSMTSLSCDVAVLGGGIGGLHSALRFAQAGKDVCLLEAGNYAGGRLKGYDWATEANEFYSDVGGIHIGQYHHNLKWLAFELKMSVEWHYFKDTMVTTRGIFAKSISTSGTPASATNIRAYPLMEAQCPAATLAAMPDFFSDPAGVEGNMWLLLAGDTNMTHPGSTNLPDTTGYTSMRDYARGVLGPEGYKFLTDNFRFRADFTDNDIRSYLQFANEDYSSSPDQYIGYTSGGLSQIARSTAAAAIEAGAKVILNDPVLDLSGGKAQGYCVTTQQRVVKANSVIVAIDPGSFVKVTGNIASALQIQKSFKDAKPIPVVTIAQRYATRWWESSFDGNIRRAWTTESCVNFAELPLHTYGMARNAARVVYADGQCAQYWKVIQEADPTLELMKQELQRHLAFLFNMTVPAALETAYQYWPDAWHFQYPGAERDMYGLQEWAKNPIEGENISLVGEAWAPLRAWAEGALKSSINALNANYALNVLMHTSSNDTFPDNGNSEPFNTRRLHEAIVRRQT